MLDEDKPPSSADANVMVGESNVSDDGGELVFELPNGILSQWQVGPEQKDNHGHFLDKLKNQFIVNDEFVHSASHDMILHATDQTHDSQRTCPSRSHSNFQPFYGVLRNALETGFSVSNSLKNECECSGDLDPDGTGIIDTGASKSVIGEKRVSPLLKIPDSKSSILSEMVSFENCFSLW